MIRKVQDIEYAAAFAAIYNSANEFANQNQGAGMEFLHFFR